MRVRGWMVFVVPFVIGMASIAPAGMAIFGSFDSTGDHGPEQLEQVAVPGKGTFEVEEPGEYKLYYEYVSRLDGENYNTTPGEFDIALTVKDPGGVERKLRRPDHRENYNALDGRFGYLIAEFDAPESGTYRIVGEGESGVEPKVVAVGPGLFDVPGWAAQLARWGSLLSLVSFIVLLVRWRRDRRRRREAMSAPQVPPDAP